eukprot:TRINITY_DN1046_c0_g1_i3.p1 TRINITY_DN1046_c0_g1~~TRINITY_DN1046_c0_g1_i3.p1  ORF type:complete len:288 (+),score=40.32 TRINITY_DN1046_c0_g1_i3:35-898(+)
MALNYAVVCLLFAFVAVSVRGQPTEEGWFCDVDLTLDVFNAWFGKGSEVNYTELEPATQLATTQWDATFEGLSLSEKLERIPQAFFDILDLVYIVYPEYTFVWHFAVYEGFERSENGTELFLETLKRPDVWAESLALGINAFNFSCYSDDLFALTANILIYIEPVLQPKYQDDLADFLVGLTVELAKTYKAEQGVVDVLAPIIQTLQQSNDISDVLSRLLSLASDDVVSTAFEEAIKGADLDTDGFNWGQMVSAYFDVLKNVFDFQDSQFIEFIVDHLKSIVQELKK